MKLVTPEQMKAIDASAITEYGIPGILLMENAAAAVTAEALFMLAGDNCTGNSHDSKKGTDANGRQYPGMGNGSGSRTAPKILVLAGSGNNGGDAFAAARQLRGRGTNPVVYLVGEKASVTGDARINLDILEKTGLTVTELNETKLSGSDLLEELLANLHQSELILDGIFGTGLSREVSGLAKLVIEAANGSGKPILSIDIPSGIDGRDGSIKGACIHADVTVTFCLPKTGLVLHPGCEYVGRLVTADISIPSCVLENRNISAEYIDKELVSGMIPKRTPNSNKGDYGRLLIVTGSTGMTGSGCLSSMAALRSGTGLVYVGVPKSLASIYGSSMKEPITVPLEDNGSGCLAAESAVQILTRMNRMDAAAVGPGLTSSSNISEIVNRVLRESNIPLVLDADALNSIAGNTSILKGLEIPVVITPHPGEMSRLTGLGTDEIQADRIGLARSFASDYKVTVVLKGSRTVVALPDGRMYINSTGNAGMATAGTGDVLTGIIAGLIAQGMDAGNAAIAGVYLHGLAGDLASEKLGMHGMLAGDVVDMLPLAIKRVLE